MKQKIRGLLLLLCVGLLAGIPSERLQAATGKTTVALSGSSVNIGDTVKVTVKASGPSGEKTVSTMTLSYDTDIFSFVDCSATYGGGGSSVTATSDSFTVTLKAVGAGSGKLSVSGSDGVVFDTNEELDSMEGSSATVTVNNAAGAGSSDSGTDDGETTDNAQLSADNSLKVLSISPGTLSPAFAGSTVQYSATVPNDVTSVAVTATPVNENASVESVTGNENLAVGVNAVRIVVKAENGVTATYTINVTREAGTADTEQDSEQQTEETTETTDETVTVNNVSYVISETFTAEEIPADFVESQINYHGSEYKGVSYSKGSISMLYLTDAQGAAGKFFLYDASVDAWYPFIRFESGENYVIWIPVPGEVSVPETLGQTAVTLSDGTGMAVYQQTAEGADTNFSLFYGINQEGTAGWYQYDALEGTWQRQNVAVTAAEQQTGDEEDDASNLAYLQEEYNTLSEQYQAEKSFSRNVIGILVFAVAVLVIVIVNLLLRGRGKSEDDFQETEPPEEKEPVEERFFEEPEEKEEKPKNGFFRRHASERIDDELAWDGEEPGEDEWDEEPEPEKTGRKKKREEKVKEPESEQTKDDDLEVLDLNDL